MRKSYMQLETVPENGIMIFEEGMLLRVFFDFEKVVSTMEDAPKDHYSCTLAEVTGSKSYGAIVGAIVNGSYSNDDAQAVIANHALAQDTGSGITDGKRTEYENEYNAFQTYRAHAKEIAAEVVKMIG